MEYFSCETLFPSISLECFTNSSNTLVVEFTLPYYVLFQYAAACWAKIASSTISKLRYFFSDAW